MFVQNIYILLAFVMHLQCPKLLTWEKFHPFVSIFHQHWMLDNFCFLLEIEFQYETFNTFFNLPSPGGSYLIWGVIWV